MAEQLRWILALLGIPLLAGIWWWGTRRSRQSPGNAEFREAPTASGADVGLAADEPPTPIPTSAPPVPLPRMQGESRDWGVPPLEPLNIRTADFDAAEFEDLPMTAGPDPLESTLEMGAAEREHAAREFVRVPTLRMDDAVPTQALEESPPMMATPPPAPVQPALVQTAAPDVPAAQEPNSAPAQRIIGVRVCASGEGRWAGSDLIAALQDQDFVHGRYQVFHRRHSDGRTLFCAASLVEPGTFDIERMVDEEHKGLTLFAVLPGPADPVETLESMIVTASALAQALQGVLQDAKGAPLSRQRAEALRDEVARFQSQLAMN